MHRIFLLAAFLLGGEAAIAQASLVQIQPNKFAVLSGFNHEQVTELIFDGAKLCYNVDTLVVVKRNGRAGLISESGRAVVPLEFDLIDDGLQTGLPIGVVGAKKGEMFSLWNVHEGRKMVEGDFEWARAIYANLLVGRRKGHLELDFFNENGLKLFTLPGKSAWPGFNEATIKVFPDDSSEGAFYDRKGRLFFPEKFKNADWADSSEVIVAEHNSTRMVVRSSLLTAAGDTILQTDSVYFTPIGGRRFYVQTVKRPQKMGLFDAAARRWIIPMEMGLLMKMGPKNDRSGAFFRNEPGLELEGRLLFDSTGQLLAAGFMPDVLRPERNLATIFKNNHQPTRYFLGVKSWGEIGLFAADGRAIIPMTFSKIAYAAESHPVIVQKSLRYGDPNPVYNAIDLKTGKKLFDEDFPELHFTADPSRFIARKNDRYGIIEVGKEASASFEFDRLSVFSSVFTNFLFWMRKEGKYHIVSPDGRLDDQLIFDNVYLPIQANFEKYKTLNRNGPRLVALGKLIDRPNGIFYIDERGGKTFIDEPAQIEAPPTDDWVENVVVEAPPMVEETPRAKPQPEGDDVFTLVEKKPEFPGGEAELYKYLFLSGKLHYPAEAVKNGTEGRVILNFVVEKDGSLSDVQIVRDIGYGCGAEAVRAVKAMPKWTPGQQRGQAVRVKYTLPVLFKLD